MGCVVTFLSFRLNTFPSILFYLLFGNPISIQEWCFRMTKMNFTFLSILFGISFLHFVLVHYSILLNYLKNLSSSFRMIPVSIRGTIFLSNLRKFQQFVWLANFFSFCVLTNSALFYSINTRFFLEDLKNFFRFIDIWLYLYHH